MDEDTRIEGEFHYVVQRQDAPWYWAIHRKADNAKVMEENYGPGFDGRWESDVREDLELRDEQARHFLEFGKASVSPSWADIAVELETALQLIEDFPLWVWRGPGFMDPEHYCFDESGPFEYVPGAPAGGHGDPPPEHMIPERRHPSALAALIALAKEAEINTLALERLAASSPPHVDGAGS